MDRKEFITNLENNNHILIVFITATWCGPCAVIKPFIEKTLGSYDYASLKLDVDNDSDAYAFLRAKKQVKGVPTLLAYFNGNIIPSKSISGTNERDITSFFDSLDFI